MKRVVSFHTLLCLCFYGWVVSYGHPIDIMEFLREKEDLVESLAKDVSHFYDQRLVVLEDCDCAMHACSYEYISDTCYSELGSDASCGQNCAGRKLNYNKSVIYTPPGIDLNHLSTEMKTSICVFEDFDKLFKNLYPKVTSSTYIGLKNGIHVRWPAAARKHGPDGDPLLDGCRFFDPRERPWYSAANTGSKNIVFVIDRSETMRNERMGTKTTQWKATTEAIKKVIATLKRMDYFGFVAFASSAETLWNEESLVQATKENREAFVEALRRQDLSQALKHQDLSRLGTTSNFDAAFRKTFDLLIGASKNGSCPDCETVILFMTDHKSSSKNKGKRFRSSEITASVERLQAKFEKAVGKRASIFTYSLGIETEDSILKQIACRNNGAWFLVRNEEEIFQSIRNHYLFFASRESQRLFWTEPYIDDFTGNKITTLTFPIYASGTHSVSGDFIGVLGHDVFLSKFEKDEKEIEAAIQSRNENFSKYDQFHASPCQIQEFRYDFANGMTCVDPFPIETATLFEANENPQCFTDSELLYKRFSALMNWEEARMRCEEDGGQLVNIESDEKLAFVVRLASEDGSWIGIRRNMNDSYVWLNESIPHLSKDSKYWALRHSHSFPKENDCVTMDSRGPLRNLNPTHCENAFSFICEYKNDESCKGDILKPQESSKGYFSVPSLEFCASGKQKGSQTATNEATTFLDSWDVICPFRKPRTDYETICCDGCHIFETENECDATLKVVIVVALIFGILVVFIWVINRRAILLYFKKTNRTDLSSPYDCTERPVSANLKRSRIKTPLVPYFPSSGNDSDDSEYVL